MSRKESARAVISSLKGAGYAAFLVGGCVRDLLLHREPKDYDVATSATPWQVVELFPGSHLVGALFGVVIVGYDGDQIEVATFRSDHDYADGRRPAGVTFELDPSRDVQRRDFTVNALLLDPESGEVVDYVSGIHDLQAHLIRAIGEPVARFREDHLRLLRAVRFAASLDFTIEPGTLNAVAAERQLLQNVSAERLREELSRMLTGSNPRRAFELLDHTGLLHEVLPEVAALKGVEQPPEFHPEGDVWTHTTIMLQKMENPSVTLAWGVLLHDIGKPATFQRPADRIRFHGHVEAGISIARSILTRLRFSNDDITQVLALVANHMRFKDVPQMKESTLKRFLRLADFQEHLALHRLDCLSSHGSLESYAAVRRKLEQTPSDVLKPQPLLTGKDLIDAGYKPGPAFRVALDAAEEAQLNGEVESIGEAMRVAQAVLGAVPPS